jgi:hypothetical protein
MKTAAPILAGTLAVFTALALSGPGEARSRLPAGLERHSFTMAPGTLKRYCLRRWNGRFWHMGERFGCDDMKHSRLRLRVDCLSRQCTLVITHVPTRFGGGGGGLSPSVGGGSRGGQQGGPSNQP